MTKFSFWLFFIFLLTSCLHTSKEQKHLLLTADSMMQVHPENALKLLNQIPSYKTLSPSDQAFYALLMTQALDKCDSLVQSDTLIRIATGYYGKNEPIRAGYAWFYLARCERNQGNARGQADALLKAQEYALKINDYKLLGFIYNDKARIFRQQRQLDSMLKYSILAFHCLKKAKDQRNVVVCLLDIGASCSLVGKKDSALYYSLLALDIAKRMKDPLLITSCYRDVSFAYYEKGNYSLASYFSHLSTKISDYYDFNKWINLGLIYFKMNQIDSSRFYLAKCSNPHEMTPTYYRLWKDIYKKEGNLQKALAYSERLTEVKDSLNKCILSENFSGMEKKYKYQELNSKNKSLIIKNQQKDTLILSLFLALSVVIIFFIVSKNRQALNNQRFLTKKEAELVKQEQERVILLQKQIDLQQNVLVAIPRLKLTVSDLIKQYSNLVNQRETKPSIHPKIEKAIINLTQQVTYNIDILYNNISKRLSNANNELTDSDILICCLILADFDSNTIASLLGILPKSYNMRRTQLRKKLNLSHDINLAEYLSKF